MTETAFNLWWDTPYLPINNPFTSETPAWWSWEAWQAATKVEREACAKLLEGGSFLHDQSPAKLLADEAAKAIRARGKV